MHSSKFFRLFPPPKFMVLKLAGLDISDDSIRCLEYSPGIRSNKISKYDSLELPDDLVSGGDIKDKDKLLSLLSDFNRKNNLYYVKVSVPEEKAYLFQTDVPDDNFHVIAQNIEFKLENNVPLSAKDAVFYFDILPGPSIDSNLRASVSVVPRTYIDHQSALLEKAGMFPVAFEVVPKSIAKAVVTHEEDDNVVMIVHIMNKKTGIYVVTNGIVCFTQTISWGAKDDSVQGDFSVLSKEINRVYTYWLSHGTVTANIKQVIVVGKGALKYENSLKKISAEMGVAVSFGNVWHNTLNLDHYLPQISKDESLDYAVVAGLASTN